MKIEKTENEITVKLENQTVRYDRGKRSFQENYLTKNGVEKIEAWKKDLIENYGVDLDELRN